MSAHGGLGGGLGRARNWAAPSGERLVFPSVLGVLPRGDNRHVPNAVWPDISVPRHAKFIGAATALVKPTRCIPYGEPLGECHFPANAAHGSAFECITEVARRTPWGVQICAPVEPARLVTGASVAVKRGSHLDGERDAVPICPRLNSGSGASDSASHLGLRYSSQRHLDSIGPVITGFAWAGIWVAPGHGSGPHRGGSTQNGPIDAGAKKFATDPSFPLDSRAILGGNAFGVVKPCVDVAGLDVVADKRRELCLGARPLNGGFNGLSGSHHEHRVSKVVCIMKANKVARKRRTLQPMRTMGTIVQAWRKAADLSTQELADKVGTSRQNIENFEKGDVKRPHYLTKIARAMGYTVEDLEALRLPPKTGNSAAKYHGNDAGNIQSATYAGAVPFVAWQRIRDVVLLLNEKIESDVGPTLLASGPIGPRVKATIVPDDSIVAELSPGTIVLLDPDAAPMDGDVVLATMLDGSAHLRVYRALADGSFDVETTAPRLQSWNSVKHGIVVTAVVIAEYKQRRRLPMTT